MSGISFAKFATDWLTQNQLGYSGLNSGELDAIHNFALLWSVFEGYVCEHGNNRGQRCSANLRKLSEFVDSLDGPLAAPQQGNEPRINDAFAHFQARYVSNGEVNHLFEGLGFLGQNEENFRRILVGTLIMSNPSTANILKSLLFIIYRLRNNLFHGVKWSYHMRGQQKNFEHASLVLMAVMDIRKGA